MGFLIFATLTPDYFTGNVLVFLVFGLGLCCFGVWHLPGAFYWALRFSHRGRGTLLLQPKRVPRKGRHVSCAPKKTGVPI